MSKYAPLREFLVAQNADRVPMSFDEIESVLSLPLPASKQYPAWWSNNPSNNPMTREWLEAGFETESVNVGSGKLVFRRVRKLPPGDGAPAARAHRHPGFGFMKGLITIEAGFDVTKPFDDEPWDRGYLGGGTQARPDKHAVRK
ncbi:DUF7662 domain-containing protein [Mesorhizobium australafricanum]|uniref:DUF7662 domain-containing protein n=1 Tax=Mesorhizobium australafricanum TaxID=3072311 RepID=A0ABU4WXL4_9HYPH|nr:MULTISPECIES: hypothetical protein [unclassified Mesorhizobium]MDX8440802.1 hypothetical protein [Mesorhizobium sp. VK3E]MDX8454131.1 hypothetical protein [Mesorhizobium sp. VK9D]